MPDRSVQLLVPCDLLSVTLVRRRLSGDMEAHGCDPQMIHDAAMVLSELLMNAIVHGRPDADEQVTTGWSLHPDGRLLVYVGDSGDGFPHVESPSVDDGGGRGLQLVDRLADSWTVTRRDGTLVRADISPRTSPTTRRAT